VDGERRGLSTEAWIGIGLSVVGLLVSIATLQSPEPPPPPIAQRLVDPGDHVLLFGDSIAEGLAVPLAERLGSYGSPLAVVAHRGDSITTLVQKATHELSAYKVIVLSVGSNDLLQAPREVDALAHLLAALRQQGALVIWLVPPSFHADGLTPQQAAVVDLMRSQGVPLVPLRGPPVRTDLDPMRIHPDPAGYRQLAAQIADALTSDGRFLPV